MDYSNDTEPCEWQEEDYYLQKDSHLDISHCLWDEANQTEEDLSYMFEEITPVKACVDLDFHVSESGRNMNKELEQFRESSSQVKRRRMLQFNTHHLDNEQISSAFVKSKDREDLIEEIIPETSQWISEFSDRSASCIDNLGQSSDGWLANCFNDADMNFSSDDMNFSGASDELIDISEFCNLPPEMETDMVQGHATPNPRSVFQGRKSYMRTPTKLASSIAYPFALIKPCGVHGDVTLKDINQRIRTPPPLKSNRNNDGASASYPTSAFSGKPVVGKTKIRTEGGKGSITIMRTKG